jgi:tRNA 5-methylaminomethyl-2-thiouridine biosynthesis bifunctional protein
MKKNGANEFNVIIVGAGVAGCAIAGQLHHAGYNIALIEQHQEFAQETSSHATALAHPQIGKKLNKLMRFTKIANEIAHIKWKKAQLLQGALEPRRDLDRIKNQEITELIQASGFVQNQIKVISREEAFVRTNIDSEGIWYGNAAIYSLPYICELETKNLPKKSLIFNTKIKRMLFEGNVWKIFSENNEVIAIAPMVVLSAGINTKRILEDLEIDLVLRPVRGQLTQFKIHNKSALLEKLPKAVLRGDGYCLPIYQQTDQHCLWEIGSSYDEDQDEKLPWKESDKNNAMKGLDLIGCDHSLINEMEAINAFVGIRSASKDRLPLIGPIKGHQGLLISSAYGSRGVLWSALGASIINAYVEAFFAGADRLRDGFLAGASEELAEEVASAVSPSRFLTARASNSKPIFPDS